MPRPQSGRPQRVGTRPARRRRHPCDPAGGGARLNPSVASPPRFAFVALVAANIILGFGPLLVRMSDTGPVAAGFWRLSLALPILLAVALAQKQLPARLSPKGWWFIALAGLFFAADLASWNYGIVHTKLTNASLFGNISSLLLPLWGALILRQITGPSQIGALIMALIGALLMMGSSYELAPENLVGDIFSILAGLFYTVYLLLLQDVRQKLGSWAVLALSTAASCLPQLGFAMMLGERIIPHDWTPVILFALSSQVIGQGVLIYSLAHFTPLVIGVVLLVQPVFAGILGWVWFGEQLTPVDFLGAALMAVALVLVRVPNAGGPGRDKPA